VFRKRGGGVRLIEVQTESGNWEVQSSKEQIEVGCLDENTRRFTQANHTPSLQRDQITLLGWTGNTPTSIELLQGTVDPRLHANIIKLAPQLKTPAAIRNHEQIKITISKEEYHKAWKNCRESISSGKSTLHFGHFKASCANEQTAEVDRILAEIPFRTGYSLKRWHWAIDVMIPKKVIV
jgi:hypothetical protein